MGRFSNGTEGMIFEEQFCSRCIHGGDVDKLCPVWMLHLDWNIEQHKDPTKRQALDAFIVRDESGESATGQRCVMFVEEVAGKSH